MYVALKQRQLIERRPHHLQCASCWRCLQDWMHDGLLQAGLVLHLHADTTGHPYLQALGRKRWSGSEGWSARYRACSRRQLHPGFLTPAAVAALSQTTTPCNDMSRHVHEEEEKVWNKLQPGAAQPASCLTALLHPPSLDRFCNTRRRRRQRLLLQLQLFQPRADLDLSNRPSLRQLDYLELAASASKSSPGCVFKRRRAPQLYIFWSTALASSIQAPCLGDHGAIARRPCALVPLSTSRRPTSPR